uniref:VWFA domain-containing protein n=1 Tax=Rhabditophanes sp. KR3021 TaxID=114890 RepID=A0AC35UE60_9BILA
MASKTWRGTSLLDEAKAWVDSFVRSRSKDISGKGDKYLLFSLEDYPKNLKVGFRESTPAFLEQLKLIRPCGPTPVSTALAHVFRFLNQNRRLLGTDRYGYGRSPQLLQDTLLVFVTDGASTNQAPIQFPTFKEKFPEFFEQPFRWDQRFFSVVLRIPGIIPHTKVMSTNAILDGEPYYEPFCNATGGRSFSVKHINTLASVTDFLYQKAISSGPQVKFDLRGYEFRDDREKSGILNQIRSVPVLIREQRPAQTQAMGNWLIPENFWPQDVKERFPVRPVHPVLIIRADVPLPNMSTFEFPFDRYELESCALTNLMLRTASAMATQNTGTAPPNLPCWPIYIENSGPTKGYGETMGFLKPNTNLSSVSLFLLPYNFPKVNDMLVEYKTKNYRLDQDLNNRFEKLLKETPFYYYQNLKKQFSKRKLLLGCFEQNMSMINTAGYSQYLITEVLQKTKDCSKKEFDESANFVKANITGAIALVQSLNMITGPNSSITLLQNNQPVSFEVKRSVFTYGEQKSTYDFCDLSNNLGATDAVNLSNKMKNLKIEFSTNPMYTPFRLHHSYKNSFALKRYPHERGNRSGLLDQTLKIMANCEFIANEKNLSPFQGGVPGEKKNLFSVEEWHQQKIVLMGDYDAYNIKRLSLGYKPLRDAFAELSGKKMGHHEFGNPFKGDNKKSPMEIDEVGEENVSESSNGNRRNKEAGYLCRATEMMKRKKGPVDMDRVMSFMRRKQGQALGMLRTDGYASDTTDAESSDGFESDYESRAATPDLKMLPEDNILDKVKSFYELKCTEQFPTGPKFDSASLKSRENKESPNGLSESPENVNLPKGPLISSNPPTSNGNGSSMITHGKRSHSVSSISDLSVNPNKIKRKKVSLAAVTLQDFHCMNGKLESPTPLISRKRKMSLTDIQSVKQSIITTVRLENPSSIIYEKLKALLDDSWTPADYEAILEFCIRECRRLEFPTIIKDLEADLEKYRAKKIKL